MTPQEESMLNDLIGRVEQTQLTEKDPEAEQLLLQTSAAIPTPSTSWRKRCWYRSMPWSRLRRRSTSCSSNRRHSSSNRPTPPASWAAC